MLSSLPFGLSRWLRLARHRWTTLSGRFKIVLIYHRVTPEVATDPQMLRVIPSHFAEQLAWLRTRFELVPLVTLFETHKAGPHAAITFDDGYADNFHHALPILEEFRAPATVFVASGQVGAAHEFWWDELERLLLLDHPGPDTFVLHHAEQRYEFAAADRGQRQAAYSRLMRWLLPLAPAEQKALLRQLREAFPAAPRSRESHRALTRDELGRLASSSLISIGGHTVDHVALGRRAPAEQGEQVERCVRDLRQWTGQAVNTFSYPYGTESDIGEVTCGLVGQAGCHLARANWPGLVRAATDPFRLPGLLVRNWNGPTLAARLTRYLHTSTYDANTL